MRLTRLCESEVSASPQIVAVNCLSAPIDVPPVIVTARPIAEHLTELGRVFAGDMELVHIDGCVRSDGMDGSIDV